MTARMMLSSTLALSVFAVSLWLLRPVRAAGVPQSEPLFYSGVLETNAGELVDDDLQIIVKLFDAGSGGAELCQTVPSGTTPVRSGRFRIPLASSCVAAVQNDSEVWVEVSVDGDVFARSKIGAVPYAIEAASATRAQVASSVDDGAITNASVDAAANINANKIAGTAATLTGNQSFDSGTLYVDASGNRVGVGTTNPAAALDVNGNAVIANRRVPFAVVAQSCASSSCSASCPAGTTIAMAYGFHGIDGNTSDSSDWMCGGAWEWSGSCLDQDNCTIATQCASSAVRLYCW